MPYAAALGVVDLLEWQLMAANSRGHTPAWFGSKTSEETWDGGFYPHWIAFHTTLMPRSTDGGGAGGYVTGGYGDAGGGGVSAGGGGAGGGF